MKPYLICPNCGSDDISKNGTSHRGKQNYICRDCGRQFVENPQRKTIDGDTLALVEWLLFEQISLVGIARAVQVSTAWLQQFVNRLYQRVRRAVNVLPKAQRSLTVQLDELWSFVNSKGEQQ